MLNERIAAKHFLRLMCLRYAPRDDARQKEIIDALREACASPDHCARTVDSWIRKHSQFPTPADIYLTAESISVQVITARPDRECPSCGGIGWERVWQLETREQRLNGAAYKTKQTIEDTEIAIEIQRKVDGKTQMVHDCVRPCTHCPYGRSLADAQARRNTSAA